MMGYLHNHLATIVMGVFAAILTGLWPVFVEIAPILHFVFLMAVPIAWFLTFMCWIVQKSVDYVHTGSNDSLKKNNRKVAQVYTASGNLVSSHQVSEAKSELGSDLDELHSSVGINENEIENLKQEISNLKTMVEIEDVKEELEDLKKKASKEKKKRQKGK